MTIAGLVLSIIGAAVFALPYWLPQAPGALAGQAGGLLIGAGLALALLGLWRR